MEKQTRSTSDELEKERESYIRQCNSLNIEPTLEFLLALCDSDMKSCVLSKRKKPLVNPILYFILIPFRVMMMWVVLVLFCRVTKP